MDTRQQFRIDAYTATKEKPIAAEQTDQPFAFQSHLSVPKGETVNSVDFRKLDKSRFGFAYSYLTKVEYDPSVTDEKIVAEFSGQTVTIKGVNLVSLYEAMLGRRLVWVGEVDTRLLERYQELQMGDDKLAGDIPVVVNINIIS